MAPGMLWATMQPDTDITDSAFNDWYNNEHGPLRLQLPFITSGRRYRATDGETPEWMAYYEITNIDQLLTNPYRQLQERPSKREADMLRRIKLDQYLYAEEISVGEINRTDRVPYLCMTLRMWLPENRPDMEADIHAWYVDEHIPLLAKIPGWVRSRRFRVIDRIDGDKKVHWFATHEYTKENGVGGPEYNYARATVWRQKIMSEVRAIRRNYQLYYDIGPLARDLACLDYAPRACIEGEFRLSDGETTSYRLEGSTDPCAPVIAFSNSFLTTWHIWDAFLEEFTAVHPQFRFLRYNQRSYTSATGSAPITIDVLTDDLKELLDGLLIASAHTVIGVSLGGATALNFALKYTPRLTRFVACDFAASSGPKAADAWGARVALAQQGMEKLALANVKRWFLPENVRTESGRQVLRMVQENNFDGFKKGTNALIHLDLEPKLPSCQVSGLFVSGACDSMLPVEMARYAKLMPTGLGSFAAVPDAGHLPMVDNPLGFMEKVATFVGFAK